MLLPLCQWLGGHGHNIVAFISVGGSIRPVSGRAKANNFRQARRSSDLLAFPQFPQASPQDIVVKNPSQTTP